MASETQDVDLSTYMAQDGTSYGALSQAFFTGTQKDMTSPSFGGRRANGATVDSDDSTQRTFLNLGYFNLSSDYDPNDDEARQNAHIDLYTNPEARGYLRALIAEKAKAGKIKILTPFVDEASVGGVINYAASIVGIDNVIVINSDAAASFKKPDQIEAALQASYQAAESGARVVYQNQVLKGIKWSELHKRGIMPTDAVPSRGKGLTLLSGLLYLSTKDHQARGNRAQGLAYDPADILEDDTIIMTLDTDVVNPDEYDAITHAIGFVLASENPDQYISGQTARMGKGRNNYPVAYVANKLAQSEKPIKREMGVALLKNRWALSGEWWVRYGALKNMIFSNGMGIETTKNIFMAGATITDGTEHRAQVADVRPKNEVNPTNMEFEWKMIQALAYLTEKLTKRIYKTGKLFHEWGVEEIQQFNEKYGGNKFSGTVPHQHSYDNEDPIHDITYATRSLDVLIPSYAILLSEGFLDIQQITEQALQLPEVYKAQA